MAGGRGFRNREGSENEKKIRSSACGGGVRVVVVACRGGRNRGGPGGGAGNFRVLRRASENQRGDGLGPGRGYRGVEGVHDEQPLGREVPRERAGEFGRG